MWHSYPTTKTSNNYQKRIYDNIACVQMSTLPLREGGRLYTSYKNIALQSKDSRYLSETEDAVKLWKVWTEESFQKLVEFDRTGERSLE